MSATKRTAVKQTSKDPKPGASTVVASVVPSRVEVKNVEAAKILAPKVAVSAMGRTRATRITAKDMAKSGGVKSMIQQLVKQAQEGDLEAKEVAAQMLSSLAFQNHGEHLSTLFGAGAMQPLVRILSEGSPKAQEAAARALRALVQGEREHQAAMVESGCVEPLVRLLKSGSAKVQEEAASALAALDTDTSHQMVIINAGGIAPLVAVLKGGSAAAQTFASQALANAAEYDHEAGQNAIVRAGALPMLLGLLAVGKAQTPAAFCLSKLAHKNKGIQTSIAVAGGIAPLLSLLNGRNLDAQVQAAAALAEVARDNIDTQGAIAKAGGIRPLLALLASRSSAAQSKGMVALAMLSRNNPENQNSIAQMGGIKPLVQLLEGNGNTSDVPGHAAFALMEICFHNSVNQRLVVDCGGISQLGELMKNAQLNVKAEVAGALWSLSEDPEIKILIAQAQQNTIQHLVELLGVGHERACAHAAKAIGSLALDNKENQEVITRLLINLLSKESLEAQERAASALWALVEANRFAHDTIAKAGNPQALVELLKDGIPRGKDYAVWALSLSISTDNQTIVADAGGVEALVEQLGDSRSHIQEQAAAALAALANNNEDTQSAITSVGGIQPLIGLLDSKQAAGSENVLTCAASALANLAVQPESRDEIVTSGGIHHLVSLLQGDGCQSKVSASTALARLSKDHEATQAAIAEAGAIVPLVSLLNGTEGLEAQEEAAGALCALAEHKGNRLAITESDGVGWLVGLLACENPRARAHAEGALVRLSIEDANRALIIEKLVDMVRNTDITGQEQAAAALANLARESEDNRTSIVGADGIPPLLALLDSHHGQAKENAISAITELCRGSKDNQAAIAKVGGVPKLVGVLLDFSGSSMKEMAAIQLCSLAASAVKEMAKGNRKNQDAIFSAGAIPALVSFLGAPAPQLQANAAGALANLARNHLDNQAAIARTGAIAPLCNLVREGSAEAKDRSAACIWSLSTDNSANKDTIAKLGGIDPLLGLLVTGTTEKSREYVSGGLCALAMKHPDNRALIAKRLVGLLGSAAAKAPERAVRVLMACSSFVTDLTDLDLILGGTVRPNHANQIALAKAGAIPPLIIWLASTAPNAQAQAAHAVLCLAIENTTTQNMITKSHGVAPLISLVRKSSPSAQDYATRALWHLASQPENLTLISETAVTKPLIGLLSAEGELPELSAITLTRLMRGTPAPFSISIADKGGIIPLVRLIGSDVASIGAQQQAAAALAELALVSRIRDQIANAGGIKRLIKLLTSNVVGTAEIAGRVLAHLSLAEDENDINAAEQDKGGRVNKEVSRKSHVDDASEESVNGADERRAMIHRYFGVKWLIAMLDGSNLKDSLGMVQPKMIGLPPEGVAVGMFEQAAATLAELAHGNDDMQDAIIDAGALPRLLSTIRGGSQLGQEYAARAVRNLASQIVNQSKIVECGAILDLVQLTKIGSQPAQMVAAAGLSELASGAMAEKYAREDAMKQEKAELTENEALPDDSASPKADKDAGNDRLILIAEAGGITPLVSMLYANSAQARENAAGALMHLAVDRANQVAIAKANGIAPLVNILDDGSELAHKHAAEALQRLAAKNEDNQTQSAKHLVMLLGNDSDGAQCRAARVISELATNNPGSPVIIVNAGAISPLVNLLSHGTLEVKQESANALSTLSLNSPSTQLAIATGLVALIGVGTAEAQEHTTKLLLTLAHDADNRVAIAKAGAIPQLVVQLRGSGQSSLKAQELAAAVLSFLSSSSESNVAAIASANGIRPLVTLLTSESASAQAHASAVLSDLAASKSPRNKATIVSEGGITPLVALLNKDKLPKRTRAEAAGALLCLSAGQPETQKMVADAGAIKPLVSLLNEDDDYTRKKAAGAIAALSASSPENQDAFDRREAVEKLVGLLSAELSDEVRAQSAAALGVLAENNRSIQDKVTSSGGIAPLVAMLQVDREEQAKEEAASALWSLATDHFENQMAIADADGIAPLVAVLSLGERAQERAGGALTALALKNSRNEMSIATLIVALLGSENRQASAKAARAISRLARANSANQVALAKAGGVDLLVRLLNTKKGTYSEAKAIELFRMEMASAIWSMATNNSDNQESIANAGAILPLISLLQHGSPEVHRDVAGALWSLAGNGNTKNQKAIATSGGIGPLVGLLQTGSSGAQETAAGALHVLAEFADNRVSIADAGGVSYLIALLERGSEECKEESAGALQTLVQNNPANQKNIAQGLVEMLASGSAKAQEHVTQVLRNLAYDPENRNAIAKAGAVPELVKQLECGSPKAMGMSAQGLALLALKSAEHRATVTQELVKLLASDNEAVRQRASEALRDMAAEEKPGEKRVTASGGAQHTAGLINLLKDGLKDGRLEAQEYALWSLSSITDTVSKEAIVNAGGIKPLIASLEGGKLSAIAQEHAVMSLSGLAPIEKNAKAIEAADGIEPIVQLLSHGNFGAKEHAAMTLAQLARADAGSKIAESGGVTALIAWLVNPELGPVEIAARALSDIALDNPDTQAQITEEGATAPLIGMVGSWGVASAASAAAAATHGAFGHRTSSLTAALRLATVAAGTLATLAKGSVMNQIMMTEEGSIPPLLELLKDDTITSAHENATRALWHLAQLEENQSAILKAGGIGPLVSLLNSASEATKQYTAAALEALALGNLENQIALSRAGAIEPLVSLLGSDSKETQEHCGGVLLSLASHDEDSRNAVVKRLVGVLDMRNASAQMNAAEVLAVLAARSSENRRAITAAEAIAPLVRLLGDGSRVRAQTPQERAAAVLADLARMGENKIAIVANGGVKPLVAMLSSDAAKAQMHAAGALWHLASIGNSKIVIADAGAIPSLVALLTSGLAETQKYSAGALWHLASAADNRTAMVNAGAISPLVHMLNSNSDTEACEYAAAVLSELARTQGGNKKAIVQAGGIDPLIEMLSNPSVMMQRHAACALWGLADGKEGVYDKVIVEKGGVQKLVSMLLLNQPETCGFAAACLSCLCTDSNAKQAITESRGTEPLLALLNSPTTWLRSQAIEMLKLLEIPFEEPDQISPRMIISPRFMNGKGHMSNALAPPLIAQKLLPIRMEKSIDPELDNQKVGEVKRGDSVYVIERFEAGARICRALISLEPGGKAKGWVTESRDGIDFLVSEQAQANMTLATKMKYHFFSFQVHAKTGFQGFA